MSPIDDHRDSEIDATWRAASHEQPPPALDAAITAAARRAVGAGPKRLHARRAWWPVAAAAVVAVVAIGIVDMMPPERLAPTEIAPASRQAPSPTAPAPRQDTLRDERAAAPAAEPQPAPSRHVEAPRKIERASPSLGADVRPAASEASREAAKPGVPFPSSPSDASPALNAAAPPAADRFTAPSPGVKARQETPAAGAGAQPTPAPFAEDARNASPGAAGALAARREAASSSVPAALAKRAQDNAAPQEAPPRTVDEWIRLIRRLKAEGRKDLAAKELAAFRARYRESADALLPADLRDASP